MDNSNELERILRNFKGLTPDMLYDDLIIIHNKNSSFNEEELKKFIISFSILNTNKNDINPLELETYWEKLSKINPDKFKQMKADLEKYFKHWIQIEPQTSKNEEKNIKLYLSVDNSCLHLFANKLLLAFLRQDLKDFSFKINNDQSINRRDNVVVYCNEENIGVYIKIIQEIIKENPNLIFNSPHLLGIPYDNNIYCGFDYENGKVSYTDKLCQNVFEALKEGFSTENIASLINYKKEKLAPSIYALVDNAKTK